MASFVRTIAFKSIVHTKTQYEYYVANGATPEVLSLVAMNNKTFGEKHMENITRELFGMQKLPSGTKRLSGYDALLHGERIEIKSARYSADNGRSTFWQHIFPEYSWDILYLALLDFTDIRYWRLTKRDVLHLMRRQGDQGNTITLKNLLASGIPSVEPVPHTLDSTLHLYTQDPYVKRPHTRSQTRRMAQAHSLYLDDTMR